MELLTGEFIKKDARIEAFNLGEIIYELITDSFTGYLRLSSSESGFVDKYLLIENGKIIGSSEESKDKTVYGWDACKNFLSFKTGWFDICALQPSDMSLVKEWNARSLFTLMEDMIDLTTELEEGRGTVVDTWGSAVLAMDSKGRPYLISDWEGNEKTHKPEEIPTTTRNSFEISIDIEQDQCMVGDVISFLIQAESEDDSEIFDLEITLTIDGEEQKSFIRMIESGKMQEIEFIPEKEGQGAITILASPIGSDERREWRHEFSIGSTSKVEERGKKDELSEIVGEFQDLSLDIDINALVGAVEREGLGHMITDESNSEGSEVMEEVKEEVVHEPAEAFDHENLIEVISREIQSFGKKNRIKILNTSIVINEAINVHIWYTFGLLSKFKNLDNAQISALLENDIREVMDAEGIDVTLPLNVAMKPGDEDNAGGFEELSNAFDF